MEVAYPHPTMLFPNAPNSSPTAAITSPILEFLFFHKAIRKELACLYQDALAVEKGAEKEFRALRDRYEFLRVVYVQHSNAEDEVIFPALDSRVKNVAQTYSLEHKEESDLFDQMLELLNSALKDKSNASIKLRRELICRTEAIQTTLCQHMSKEEQQVLPLLVQHFSFEEQAALVWQFMCSIPVNLMEEFLPWLASCLSQDERQEMFACMHKIVPKEDLLRQVVFSWLKGGSTTLQCKEPEKTVDCMDLCEGITITSSLTAAGDDGFIKETSPSQKDKQVALPGACITFSKMKKKALTVGSDTDVVKTLVENCSFPIDVLLYWHNAIRKELRDFAQEAKQIQLSAGANLSSFGERLQFLAEVCIFHSAAEDKVVFPAVGKKAKLNISFDLEHSEEEDRFDNVRRLLEGVQSGRRAVISAEISGQLCRQAELIVQTVQQHLVNEETKVFPLARVHCSIEEQRGLVYKSLRVMPLKLLEKVLPWLVATLEEEEAKIMLDNICLAAPAGDAALITLLLGWACKGHTQKIAGTGRFRCISSSSSGKCLLKKVNMKKELSCCCGTSPCKSFSERQGEDSCMNAQERSAKRVKYTDPVHEDGLISIEVSQSEACKAIESCCVPGLGVGGSSLGFGAGCGSRSLRPFPSNPLQSGYLGSGLFGLESVPGSPSAGAVPKPIDTIFQFHKAIRKDLEYLDLGSAGLIDCDDEFLRQFTGRFQLLWGLYRAHSNAEDDIVFPALEAKEALHNVSHSYTMDHKHEEQLFKEISNVLSELSVLHGRLRGQDLNGSYGVVESEEGSSHQCQYYIQYKQGLAAKLQGMCKSVHVTLDQHVSREELELWPLFAVYFTVEEQERIVGQIIGTTGAEVLQAMLPWVTTALSQEEQSTMMDTWRQATRNTMFDKWLRAWWKGSPTGSPSPTVSEEVVPQSGTTESLQLVADYLSKGTSQVNQEESTSESLETDLNDGKRISCDAVVKPDNCKKEELQSGDQKGSSCEMFLTAIEKQNDCISEKVLKDKVEEGPGKFKPGWQDIFRMNEKELEAAVRKVSGDTSLDPRRKAYLMQNLMTSRWIVAQQQLPKAVGGEDEQIHGRSPSFMDANEGVFGCEHYKRNCKIRAACCGMLFPCRFCHDKVSDHTMNRQATEEMMCMRCLKIQPVAQYCATPSCNGFIMAKYFCSICKLFDDKRDIYHCPSCNLCRVGKGLGVDFFHCMTCNACMSTSLTSHKCRERGLESNCPICHDFLFTSHTPVKALACGHFMHSACYRAYTYSHYTCPICSKSLGDMAVYFGMLDALLASEQLPEEYRDRQQDILCNDCEQKGNAPFHWLYHKCRTCGSYNTRAI